MLYQTKQTEAWVYETLRPDLEQSQCMDNYAPRVQENIHRLLAYRQASRDEFENTLDVYT